MRQIRDDVIDEPDDSDTDDVYGQIYRIGKRPRIKQPRVMLTVNNTKMAFMIDSGASVNIMDQYSFSQLEQSPRLSKAKSNLYAYGSDTPIPVRGVFQATIESKNKFAISDIFVTSGNCGSLLSFQTASDLGIIHMNINAINQNITMEELARKFPQLFTGIGKLKSHQIKLHIDPNVTPIAQPHRRVPFHLQQKVEDEINNLLEQDIIERVTGPTPWMSPIVTPIKPNNPDKVRICVDMRQANKAVLRERHVSPTLQDIIHDLNGATIFSKLDLNSAYHQLELHPDSRAITNFSTNVGLFRYKRLLFGVSSSSEVFQHTISQVLNGIPGVNNISDDIIVYGKTVAEHNNNLRAVISRLVENGLTLNKEKCQLHKQSIEFYGHIFSADGVAIHPKHKTAISNIDRPQNVGDVRSFLSMISYSSRFIRDLATISEPLRNLIKQNIPWTWGDREEQSFRRLKQCLMDATFTSYFDPKKHTAITVDASPVGLSAILTQVDANKIRRVISYASRSLSDIEQRFSQTEREALACVWACEHYHRYIYGAPTFDLITDHQPLQMIYGNPRAKLPARIERWGLRLMPYSFKVVHCHGRQNPADYCSRHPILRGKYWMS